MLIYDFRFKVFVEFPKEEFVADTIPIPLQSFLLKENRACAQGNIYLLICSENGNTRDTANHALKTQEYSKSLTSEIRWCNDVRS